jgi:ribonuclease J
MAGAPQELVFAPLGGIGEIGMNLSIYGIGPANKRQWLAVDVGVSLPPRTICPVST